MEIAYRMQVNGYKIVQCHDAYVYTVTPNSFIKLYKQRIRWMYGFINNSVDYRGYILKPKHGMFSMFTIPTATVALFGTMIMSLFAFSGLIVSIYNLIQKLVVTNFHLSAPSLSHFSFFYFDIRPLTLVMIILYGMLLTMVLVGQKMRDKKPLPSMSIIYFIIVFAVMSPLWLLKAMYNTVASKETAWR